MSFRKLCLSLAFVVAAGNAAFALAYDGSPTPGTTSPAVSPNTDAARGAVHPSAAVRVRVRAMHAELDGDGNHIPGTRGR